MMSKKVLVTLANYDYMEYSKSLFASAKLSGKWDGDFVLIVPEEDKGTFDDLISNHKYFEKFLLDSNKQNS